MPKNNESCAACGKRTDFCRKGNSIKNRRPISSDKLKNYFKARNVDLNVYRFVCKPCYQDLNQLFKTDEILEHINEHNDFSRNSNLDKIDFTNERCFSLTGSTAEQFGNLLESIKGAWPYEISKSDSLFMYLARLRLGKQILV